MGLFNLFQSSKTVVVIDGVSLNESLGQKGKVAPRNQLQLLRRLSRFSQREKVALVVVLSGSPLHKAPAGKKFEDITVLYSKSPEAHAKHTVKIAKSKGQGVVLVSGSSAVEKIALSGNVKIIRVSTFRKAFDVGGNDGEGNERGGNERGGNERSSRGGNDRNNRNRPPRRRQKKQSDENKPERPAKETSEADAINELIDLVD
jgi:hypothetical protein